MFKKPSCWQAFGLALYNSLGLGWGIGPGPAQSCGPWKYKQQQDLLCVSWPAVMKCHAGCSQPSLHGSEVLRFQAGREVATAVVWLVGVVKQSFVAQQLRASRILAQPASGHMVL